MIARNQNKKVKQAFYLLAFALGMLAMSYAAVPLYKIFCKVTGYGGTPQISSENDSYKIKEKIESCLCDLQFSDFRFSTSGESASHHCLKILRFAPKSTPEKEDEGKCFAPVYDLQHEIRILL